MVFSKPLASLPLARHRMRLTSCLSTQQSDMSLSSEYGLNDIHHFNLPHTKPFLVKTVFLHDSIFRSFNLECVVLASSQEFIV